MNPDIKSFLINGISGLLTAIVFLYLDKAGFTSLAYVVFGLYIFLLSLVALHFVIKKRHAIENSTHQDAHKRVDKDQEDIFHNILALITEYHSQEIPATPEKIGKDLGFDPKIILAHMDKMHNDQFITFRNDGKSPDTKTGFFLSPKAWEHIAVVKRKPKP